MRLTTIFGTTAMALGIVASAPMAAAASVGLTPVPVPSTPVTVPLTPISGPVTSNTMDSETLSFLGMMNIANNKMRAAFPGAVLLEAFGQLPQGGMTTNVAAITDWKFTYRLPGDDPRGGGTGFIRSAGWGEFSQPWSVKESYLGNRALGNAVDLELKDAGKAFQDSEFEAPFWSVTLRWPVYPGMTQPYYIFNTVDGGHIAVGQDKSVQRFH